MSSRASARGKVAKTKITTWVDERTAGILRAKAAQQEVSMSEVVAQTLGQAVTDDAAEGVGAALLLPSVRGAVRREVGSMSNRLSNLMARSALESAANRRMLFQLLVDEYGEDEAREIARRSWASAVDDLKNPARGYREIMSEAAEEVESSEDAGDAEGVGDGSGESAAGGAER